MTKRKCRPTLAPVGRAFIPPRGRCEYDATPSRARSQTIEGNGRQAVDLQRNNQKVRLFTGLFDCIIEENSKLSD
jgi:hypothetical protein